jgi:hypothetical protein
MGALCDAFRRSIARENEVLLYDHGAKQRFGEMIGKAMRQGWVGV